MRTEGFIPFQAEYPSEDELRSRASAFYQSIDRRRTVREFSDREVPRQVIEDIIMAAGTAPSGAHKQPWTFCAISSPEMKSKIRAAAEEEEYENYHGRMSEEWLKDLQPFGTDWHKPFLEIAPWLIVVMRKTYDVDDGVKRKNYYVQESVGIACGMLLTAIHQAGLVSLTHTPSPMNFLAKILGRPENEKPFLLVPVGYAADDVSVPDLQRKSLEEIAQFY
ncbi:MAG: nitroreductase family protein [Bacteroidia bacterium]|nr:nitroreductase family protein [Bacteroidia bacterium]